MWKWLTRLFRRKPKLNLNFYDPEYDAIMNFFKQTIYIDKIREALKDKNNHTSYVIELMRSFTQVFGTAGNKIISMHHKKPLDMSRMDKDKFEKELNAIGFSSESIKGADDETMRLLLELHNLRREDRYNRIVSKTMVKTLKTIVDFSSKIHDDLNDIGEEWYKEKYGGNFTRFLIMLNNSVELYDKIGIWLKEDKMAIAKYKEDLQKRIFKHTVHFDPHKN